LPEFIDFMGAWIFAECFAVVIPFHVTEMLRRVMARYDAEETPQKMAPNDDAFSLLRPMRKISAATVEKYWARLKPTAGEADQAALADPATMEQAEMVWLPPFPERHQRANICGD
jgi:hypothetical protein